MSGEARQVAAHEGAHGDAVAELEAHAGTQFDPEIVAAFRRLVDRGVIDILT